MHVGLHPFITECNSSYAMGIMNTHFVPKTRLMRAIKECLYVCDCSRIINNKLQKREQKDAISCIQFEINRFMNERTSIMFMVALDDSFILFTDSQTLHFTMRIKNFRFQCLVFFLHYNYKIIWYKKSSYKFKMKIRLTAHIYTTKKSSQI